MARITVEDCIDKFPSRFELVLVASQRARKLHSGEETSLDRDNDKNTVIALREISEESLPIEDMKEDLLEEYQTVTLKDEEEENKQIESSEDNEINENNQNNEDQSTSASKQIEEEIKELTASEDKEIEDHYEISDNQAVSSEESSSQINEE